MKLLAHCLAQRKHSESDGYVYYLDKLTGDSDYNAAHPEECLDTGLYSGETAYIKILLAVKKRNLVWTSFHQKGTEWKSQDKDER